MISLVMRPLTEPVQVPAASEDLTSTVQTSLICLEICLEICSAVQPEEVQRAMVR